jgi:hypothetical protein
MVSAFVRTKGFVVWSWCLSVGTVMATGAGQVLIYKAMNSASQQRVSERFLRLLIYM